MQIVAAAVLSRKQRQRCIGLLIEAILGREADSFPYSLDATARVPPIFRDNGLASWLNILWSGGVKDCQPERVTL